MTLFGLGIDSDKTSHRAFIISQISTKRSCTIGKHFKSHISTYNPFKGLYIVTTNAHPYFDKDDDIIVNCLWSLLNDNDINFEFIIAFDPGPIYQRTIA